MNGEGDFAKAALWHEAAADCLKIISIPMLEIQIRYYLRHGKNVRVEQRHEELANIKKRRAYHLEAAKSHWERSKIARTSPELAAEREKITRFISTWGADLPESVLPLRYLPQFFQSTTKGFQRDGELCCCLKILKRRQRRCVPISTTR